MTLTDIEYEPHLTARYSSSARPIPITCFILPSEDYPAKRAVKWFAGSRFQELNKVENLKAKSGETEQK